jgi:hypothetical protein
MTDLDLKTIESALTIRARELVRSLAEHNQITIERAAHCVSCQAQAEGGRTLRPRLDRAA